MKIKPFSSTEGTQISKREYLDKVLARFGDTTKVNQAPENFAYTEILKHVCRCKKIFNASPKQVLEVRTSLNCLKCTAQIDRQTEVDGKKTGLRRKIEKKFKHLSILVWPKSGELKIRCACGRTFKEKPRALVKKKAKDALCGYCDNSLVLGTEISKNNWIKKLSASKKEGNLEALSILERLELGDRLEFPKSQPKIKIAKRTVKTHTLVKGRKGKVLLLTEEELSKNWKQAVALSMSCKAGIGFNSDSGFLYASPKILKDNIKTFEELLSVLQKNKLKEIVILGMDPGVTNHAWTALKVDRENFRIEILGSGMIKATIKSLIGNAAMPSKRYAAEIISLLEEFKITHIVAERYQTRGVKGSTIEFVNNMLGIVSSVSSWGSLDREVKYITAAQWKNEWNKYSDLEKFYTKTSCVVHQADATGIALYGAYSWFGFKPFLNIKSIEAKLSKDLSNADVLRNKGRVTK